MPIDRSFRFRFSFFRFRRTRRVYTYTRASLTMIADIVGRRIIVTVTSSFERPMLSRIFIERLSYLLGIDISRKLIAWTFGFAGNLHFSILA